jgi:hypothetical protein
MPIAELKKDKRLWTTDPVPVKGEDVTFFREHLQRKGFNGIVEVTKENLILKLGNNGSMDVICARSSSAPNESAA